MHNDDLRAVSPPRAYVVLTWVAVSNATITGEGLHAGCTVRAAAVQAAQAVQNAIGARFF
jgi:hypothetical protein